MKKQFTGKYDQLLETAVQRFQQGGYLTGDAIKIKKSALTNEKVKNMSDQYKERLKAFIESDVNLRVSAVKTVRSNTSTGEIGGVTAPADYFVDIVQEINPGMWVNPMTVPMEVIEKLDYDHLTSYAPVPDALKRKSDIDTGSENIGAVPETRKAEDLNLPKKNTKLAHANKWDDSKPGAGNTKDLEKLKDSVSVEKKDVDMLAETYEKNIFNEADAPIAAGTNLTDQPVGSLSNMDLGGVDGNAIKQLIQDLYKISPDKLTTLNPSGLNMYNIAAKLAEAGLVASPEDPMAKGIESTVQNYIQQNIMGGVGTHAPGAFGGGGGFRGQPGTNAQQLNAMQQRAYDLRAEQERNRAAQQAGSIGYRKGPWDIKISPTAVANQLATGVSNIFKKAPGTPQGGKND